MITPRIAEYARNERLEKVLSEINDLLMIGEERVLESYVKPRWPIVFVVGPPRSGTTLLTQWLASSGCFGYPSNLVSRFYKAPYIGAKIQLMLTDRRFIFRGEMDGLTAKGPVDFQSDLGKTDGPLGVNEFHYFWRRFFPFGDIDFLDDEALASVDVRTLVSELAALEAAFGKPLMMKCMTISCNTGFLASLLPQAIFIHVRRHPFFNIQSLLMARSGFYGTQEEWYSFKPKEYFSLKGKSPAHQVAGQVRYIDEAIQNGLMEAGKERVVDVQYEEFCREPEMCWQRLCDRLASAGYKIEIPYTGPLGFETTNRLRLPIDERRAIISAYQDLFHVDITPMETGLTVGL